MKLVELLRNRRILAIVRGHEADCALRTVITLADEGIDLVEVSLTTPEAMEVIARARRELGADAPLGAGTVLSAEDVGRARDAGANFIVTPAVTPAVTAARGYGLAVIAGALTPSEIAEALARGADAVKLFPASLGGVGYLRALLEPFPQTPFVPVGGIGVATARDYVAAGAIAVGAGSALVADAASGGSLNDLRLRARSFLHMIRQVHDDGDATGHPQI